MVRSLRPECVAVMAAALLFRCQSTAAEVHLLAAGDLRSAPSTVTGAMAP